MLEHFVRTNERHRNNLKGVRREAMMSVLGFQEDCMLHSYCPSGKKTPLMLSTISHNDAVYEETGDHTKTETINFYNMTNVEIYLLAHISR